MAGMNSDTIYALSSGSLPSGVAVIRLSGSRSRFVYETMVGGTPTDRKASLRKIYDPVSREILDECLVLHFSAPKSFTGEDCMEFQVHGGTAVVDGVLQGISKITGLRLADAGEFSRRAFENNKLDLAELEGLSDLVASQTETQRRQALVQSQGGNSTLYERWRQRLVRARALIEADFDFSDEEDVPGSVADSVWPEVKLLAEEIRSHLDDGNIGEIIREGYRVTLMGKPNAGKSSLLNALAKRDVAIVTPQAGTTRDVLSVDLNIEGFLVTLQDTAGMRETSDIVEIEGMKRGLSAASSSDLTIWLDETGKFDERPDDLFGEILCLRSKDDDGHWREGSISAETGHGIPMLLAAIVERLQSAVSKSESITVTRGRHRENLVNAVNQIELGLSDDQSGMDLRVEYLRRASDFVGKITGRVDVEDLLDVIFSEFCVGK